MENKKQIIDESTANLFKKLFAVDLLNEGPVRNPIQDNTPGFVYDIMQHLVSGDFKLDDYKFDGIDILVYVKVGEFTSEFRICYTNWEYSGKGIPENEKRFDLMKFQILDSEGNVVWYDTDNTIQQLFNREIRPYLKRELMPVISKKLNHEEEYNQHYMDQAEWRDANYSGNDPWDHAWGGKYDDVKPQVHESTKTMFQKLCNLNLVKESFPVK